jgi:hypothetical protein
VRLVCLLALAAAISGCVTTQPPGPSAENDPSRSCLQRLSQQADIAPLAKKIGSLWSANETTIQQLADTARPDEAEKAMLAYWGSERMECLARGRPFRQQWAPPGYSEVYESAQMNIVHLIARLYSGEITFGQFNVARNENSANSNARLERLRDRDMAQAAAARQQADNAALQMMLLQERQRPLQTSCYRIGSTVNCTTR